MSPLDWLEVAEQQVRQLTRQVTEAQDHEQQARHDERLGVG